MPGTRSDRARARARDLLATLYPIPDDAEFHRLRELAVDYIQEAERLEAERKGRVVESDEMISAALDAVARDYFARALLRAVSPEKALARGMERRARGNSALGDRASISGASPGPYKSWPIQVLAHMQIPAGDSRQGSAEKMTDGERYTRWPVMDLPSN